MYLFCVLYLSFKEHLLISFFGNEKTKLSTRHDFKHYAILSGKINFYIATPPAHCVRCFYKRLSFYTCLLLLLVFVSQIYTKYFEKYILSPQNNLFCN